MNRRLVLKARGRAMVIESKPIPRPPPNGMVIKVRFAGVCYHGVRLSQESLPSSFVYPRVLGHEVCGFVHSVGDGKIDGAAHFKKGERVILYPWGGCRKCEECKLGSQHCMSKDISDSFQYGTFQDGGFQEYVVVHDRRMVLRVPDSIPADVACHLPCTGLTAYNAICELELEETIARAQKTQDKAVIVFVGAGGVGIWAVKLVKAIYPIGLTVCVVDVADDSLVEAKEAGADLTLNWEARGGSDVEVAARLKTLCGGPVDGAVDFVGFAKTFERLQLSLKCNTTLVLVGEHGGQMPAIELRKLVQMNLRIQGVFAGSKAQLEYLFAVIGRYKIQPPAMTYVNLDDVNTVIDNLCKGRQKGRAVVKF